MHQLSRQVRAMKVFVKSPSVWLKLILRGGLDAFLWRNEVSLHRGLWQ